MREAVPAVMETIDLGTVLAALADPLRRRVVMQLLQRFPELLQAISDAERG
jgi:hypothetical protein